MRLDKYLSHVGLGSRKEVKQILKSGRVEINGQVVKQSSIHVAAEDQVKVDGVLLVYEQFVYYMMNKPKDVLSATQDAFQPTVLDLFDESDYRADLFPVGRLDKDTVGLLLVTNDGDLSHQLLSPKKHVAKEYVAGIVGVMTHEDQVKFAEGIRLNNEEECKPAQLTILATDEQQRTSQVKITIVEGKYHQVKRMVAACGKKVQSLQRISMGPIRLDPQLNEGQYRRLTEQELKQLKNPDEFCES